MNNDENQKSTEPRLKLGNGLAGAFSTNIPRLNLGADTPIIDHSKIFATTDKISDIGKLAKAFSPTSLEEATKLASMYDTSRIDDAMKSSSLAMASASRNLNETYKREIEKLKKSNEVLQSENANFQEEKQKLIEDLSTHKEQVAIYEAKDKQIENFVTRLKESGKLSEDELKELNASEDELDRLERARDQAIEEEKETITEAIFQITDSMKSLQSSMLLYLSLLIGAGVIAISLIANLLWGVFFGAAVDETKINGLMANYLAFASPSILKIVLLVIVLRFVNSILKLRENLLSEMGYIEKISGVLKASMLMSDYSRSMIEAREIFKKVTIQLVKKDGASDKDKSKDDDDSIATSIAEKTVMLIAKSVKG